MMRAKGVGLPAGDFYNFELSFLSRDIERRVTKKILRDMKLNVASLIQVVDGSESQVLRWPFSSDLAVGPSAPCLSLPLAIHYAISCVYNSMKGRQDRVHHLEHGC